MAMRAFMISAAAMIAAIQPGHAQPIADKGSALACLQASGFKDALVAPEPLRSSNAMNIDARLVTGTTAKGEQAMKLCLYDRRTKRVEAIDAAPWTSRQKVWIDPKK